MKLITRLVYLQSDQEHMMINIARDGFDRGVS
jgi:hypothetical protein